MTAPSPDYGLRFLNTRNSAALQTKSLIPLKHSRIPLVSVRNKDNGEACLCGHHPVAHFAGLGEGHNFDHGLNVFECGELHCFLFVLYATGGPPSDGRIPKTREPVFTSNGSGAIPTTKSFPLAASPFMTPDIAFPLGAVARRASAPPSARSLPFVAGRDRSSDEVQQELMRHASIQTTMNIYIDRPCRHRNGKLMGRSSEWCSSQLQRAPRAFSVIV